MSTRLDIYTHPRMAYPMFLARLLRFLPMFLDEYSPILPMFLDLNTIFEPDKQ